MPVLRWTYGAVVLFYMLFYVGLYPLTMKIFQICSRKSRYVDLFVYWLTTALYARSEFL